MSSAASVVRRTVLGSASLALVLAAFASGCGHDELPGPKAPAPPPAPVATQAPALTSAAVPTKTGTNDLGLSEDLMKACNIHIDNVADAPKFDFDNSELQPEDRKVLDQVAACVTTGPLKGKSLSLVGRADARGEEEYNFALGEHRASAVTGYLRQLGVDGSKLRESSRGKLDATGTDEEGWAKDRRVDIGIVR